MADRCGMCFEKRPDLWCVSLAQPNEFGGIGGIRQLWVCADCANAMMSEFARPGKEAGDGAAE